MFGKINKIHFVGIGGIGMCGIAELLHEWGFRISGSDAAASDNIGRLQQKGIAVSIGHSSQNLPDCDVVVYSAAVGSDNPELAAALERGIPAIKRAEMLGEIIRLKPNSIGISGTHGKTTTTSLIGHIFAEHGADPITVVGGVVRDLQTTTRIGNGYTIIFEADEFDRSFLKMRPTHAVITTLESDHMDIYASQEEIEDAFVQFANSVPFFGAIAVCVDEPNIRKILPRIQRRTIGYGFSEAAEFRARDIIQSAGRTRFSVLRNSTVLGSVEIKLPGEHNVKNALAAIAISLEYDIPFDTIAKALGSFQGVQRRFDIIKETPEIMLVDDYAHHPTEVSATLNAARAGWNRRIIAIFQPHLFSRTRDFYRDFATALSAADEAVILDIYPAREQPIPGITSQLIINAGNALSGGGFHYLPDKSKIIEMLNKIHRPGDLIITMGAGDIWKLQAVLKEKL